MKANKTFVKLDAYGNLIPGSSIKAPSKPKIGKWKELDSNVCCAPYVELIALAPSFPMAAPTIDLFCDGYEPEYWVKLSNDSFTIPEFITYVNEKLFYLGVFSASPEGNIVLKLKKEIADTFPCNTINFQIVAD